MSEYEKDGLSEVSNEDLEQEINSDDEEISLKEKINSDDEDDDEQIDDNDQDDDQEEDDDQEDDDDQEEDDEDVDDEDQNDEDNEQDENRNTQSNNSEDPLSVISNAKQAISEYISSSESEEEEEFDDNEQFRKIDQDLKQDYLVSHHQESKIHNFDEILNLAKINRNEKNVIVDDLHKTIPILTKYEKTRILGERTKQLNNGHKPFVEIKNDIIDGYLIAQQELQEKKIPFIIRRPLPSGGSEYWHLKDLEII
jgi:DNA-directed RNA polymerase subunit K/omega